MPKLEVCGGLREEGWDTRMGGGGRGGGVCSPENVNDLLARSSRCSQLAEVATVGANAEVVYSASNTR